MVKRMEGRHVQREREDSWENVCFICKDSGVLLLCGFSDCRKAYHTFCLGKPDVNDKEFICEYHACSMCKQRPQYYCWCCPQSVCEACEEKHMCLSAISNKKGLCDSCYVLAVAKEKEGVDPHSLMLFKDYCANLEKDGFKLSSLGGFSLALQLSLQDGRSTFSDLCGAVYEPFDESIWYYKDPKDRLQGPFSVQDLLKWKKGGNYFPEDFEVWKKGHGGIQLTTLLGLFGYFY